MQKVGKNSKGLVSDLVGSKVEESTTESVANVLTDMLKESDPCPFGYGCGGGGDIDPATKAQVANILKGMIKNLSGGHRNLMQVSQDVASSPEVQSPKMKKALGGLITTMVRVGRDSTALVSQLVGSKVADGTTDSLSAVLKELLRSKDCPFGYGAGCHG